jgi:CRISPR-associated protein Csm3
MADKTIKLVGRVLISFKVRTLSGLHIGGSDAGIEIGGVDKTVVRDPITNQPYIPGSSLRGKMRSQLEKYLGLAQNQRIGSGFIHSAQSGPEYQNSPVSQIFGVSGDNDFSSPARLIVRDLMMDPDSANRLIQSGRTDLPFTEVKTEVSIDRVTSQANPRQMERVPAGVSFGDAEAASLVYSIYSGDNCNPARDIDNLAVLVQGMQLLEDDYLGGLGSRGSGRVTFSDISLKLRANGNYNNAAELGKAGNATELAAALPEIQAALHKALGV